MSDAAPAVVEPSVPTPDENDNRERPDDPTPDRTEEGKENEGAENEGDEENKEEKGDGLDDDQREDNPAYIPRDKRYYMHDSRVSSSEAEEEGNEDDARKSRADGSWAHDRFDEKWQRPKTRKQLVKKYGFDIRIGENGEEIVEQKPLRKAAAKNLKASGDQEEQPQEEEQLQKEEQPRQERAPPRIPTRGRGRGRGRGVASRPSRPQPTRQDDEKYEDEEVEVNEARSPRYRQEQEQRGDRRRAPPTRSQRGYREERPIASGRGRTGQRGGFRQRQVEEEYQEQPERAEYRERPSQFRRGGREQRTGPAHDRSYDSQRSAPQVPYRQRGVPTRGSGGGARYPPRGNGYGARETGQYERGENRQGYGGRAFHNQSYSRGGGGGRRNDAPAQNRRDDQQSFRNNDREFPPLSRGGAPQESSSHSQQLPVFDRTRPPPMPTRGVPKRYSNQQRAEAPDNQNFIPRQPTAVVYFDPNAQPRQNAPPAPRPKKIIDIVPPKH